MAINQLKAGALLSYITLGLNNVIGLLYTPFLLRMLGQSEFGLYSLVAAVVGYLTIMDFGFGNAIIRYTARLRAQGKKEEQYSLFGMFLMLYSGIGLLAFIAGLALYFNVDKLFGATMNVVELDKARIMMLLLIFNLAITFPLSIFGSIIIAYENFVFQKMVNIVRTILNPCIMIPVLFMGYKAIGVVVIMTLLNIISLLANFWFCFAKLKIKIYFKNFEWGLLKEIAGYSFFVFLVIIVDKIYWNTGQFVLGIVAGTTVVAVYAIAIQLQMYYMSFSLAISGVFLPKVTAMVAQNKSEKEISDLFIRTGRIQYVIMAFICSGFILFGKSFIVLWAGANYVDAYSISLLLMIPFTFPLIQNLGITILQARNQQMFRAVLYIVIAACSLAISIPLAKLYGGIGCAIGTSCALITGDIIALNIYYYKRIHIDIPRFWKEIFEMSIPVFAVTAVGLAMNYIHLRDTILSLSIKIVVFTFLYFPLIWWKGINSYERILFGVPLKRILSKSLFLLKIKN